MGIQHLSSPLNRKFSCGLVDLTVISNQPFCACGHLWISDTGCNHRQRLKPATEWPSKEAALQICWGSPRSGDNRNNFKTMPGKSERQNKTVTVVQLLPLHCYFNLHSQSVVKQKPCWAGASSAPTHFYKHLMGTRKGIGGHCVGKLHIGVHILVAHVIFEVQFWLYNNLASRWLALCIGL